MPSPVYEDEKTKDATPGQHDDLNASDTERRNEIAQLEKDFAVPEADSPKSDEAKQVEAAGRDKKNSDKPSLYSPTSGSGENLKISGFRPTKKQGGVLGGFLALVIAVVVGFNALGPLQFIHFAQMLQAFHFSDQEYDGNSRIKKLLIYAKTGDVKNTRIGVVANKQAKKIDAKFAANGWDIKSTGGVFDGFEYDPDKKAGTTDDRKSRIGAEEMKANLERDGVKNVRVVNGKVIVPPDSVKYWSNKKLIKTMYTGSGNRDVGRIVAAYEKRILIKRAGLSFNPLTKVDQKINKAIANKIAEEREKRLTGKVTSTDVTASGTQAGEKPTDAEARAQAEADAANELAEKTKSGGLTKGALNGIGGVGFLCVVRSIAGSIDEGRALNKAIPMMAASAEVLGVGSKAMDGGDINMATLGEYSKSLNGRTKDNKTSWSSASTIQYEQGNLNTGGKLPDELNPSPKDSDVSQFFNDPALKLALDTACPVLESTVVTILSFALGFKGVFDAALAGALLVAGPTIIEKIESIFIGEIPNLADPKYAGAAYGEAVNVGSRIVSNETAFSMGGRPLSGAEEVSLRSEINQDKTQQNKTRSIADKYLNPYVYDSSVAKLIDSVNDDSIASSLASMPQKFLLAVVSPLSKKVIAADSVTPEQAYYGIKKVGFAPGTLDNIENPYDNALAVKQIINNNGTTYVDLLRYCNKIDVTGLGIDEALDFTSQAGTGVDPAIMGNYDTLPETCKNDKDPAFFKVRTAAYDTITMKAFSCVEFDDEDSCSSVSGTGESVADETTAAVNTAGWTWPMTKGLLVGNCWDALVGSLGYHAGMDINTNDVSENNPAVAAHDGQVVTVSSGEFSGNYITIKSTDGIYYSYQHLSKSLVNQGQNVAAGDPVGILGKTGRVFASSAGHLHFVTAKTNTLGAYSSSPQITTVDPMDYLPANAPNGYKCSN